MIKVEGLYKKFGKLHILKGVDLKIDEPGIYTIVGPNGSGKTTLLKCLLGMVIPDTGNLLVEGINIRDTHKYRSSIGYLPQIAKFPDNLTVEEIIKMVKQIRSHQQTNHLELINALNLSKVLSKKLGTLSGGTRQKVNIVLTFMFECKIYILDEPTAGLDPVSLIYLKDFIRKEKIRGKTIIITTHIMNLVEELSDEICFLLEGKIYFRGSINQLQEITKQQDLEHAIAKILKQNHID